MNAYDLFRKMDSSVTEFEITDKHLALLRRSYVSWDDCEFGAPAIDCKRPYGNSDVVRDVAEIVVDGFIDRGDADQAVYVDIHADELARLHVETGIALQICLTLGTFEAGTYRRPNTYSPRWAKVDE